MPCNAGEEKAPYSRRSAVATPVRALARIACIAASPPRELCSAARRGPTDERNGCPSSATRAPRTRTPSREEWAGGPARAPPPGRTVLLACTTPGEPPATAPHTRATHPRAGCPKSLRGGFSSSLIASSWYKVIIHTVPRPCTVQEDRNSLLQVEGSAHTNPAAKEQWRGGGGGESLIERSEEASQLAVA